MHTSVTRRYFAASNSSRGFCNYYGECFSEARVDHLYVIKGGPGTGKSHFMREVARYARERGYTVTEYACSSDPASLDGVWLTRDGSPSIALLDGTPPHVREPALPGVKEEIVNLGAFWNSRRLVGQGDTVRRLAEGQSAAFGRAYAYLAAVGSVDRAADSLIAGCMLEDRVNALVERILRRLPLEDGKEPQVRSLHASLSGGRRTPVPALRRAVSMSGVTCLHTFERESARAGGTVLVLEDHYGLAYTVTRALFERRKALGAGLLVSYDPVLPHKIDGLYHPANGLCILVGHAEPEEGSNTRAISLRRLADADALREVRGELRRSCALRESLLACALQEMASASRFHFELERIYAEAMDFGAKEAFTERFCEDVFRA